MTIYIPEDKISEIKNTANIVEVVSEVVILKKTGKNYSACCPFHEEKTPSFMIRRGDTHYHCYGCGAHGDAIQFLISNQINFVNL